LADVIRNGSVSPKAGKALAVGVIEAIDVFLIAIVAYIICLGLYSLFVDDTLPVPRWLEIHGGGRASRGTRPAPARGGAGPHDRSSYLLPFHKGCAEGMTPRSCPTADVSALKQLSA
jgi:hypothetical protein